MDPTTSFLDIIHQRMKMKILYDCTPPKEGIIWPPLPLTQLVTIKLYHITPFARSVEYTDGSSGEHIPLAK